MRLSIFAYHVQCIATKPAPANFSLSPCKGVEVKVEITASTVSQDTVWDDVKINGSSAGNRFGGVKAFCAIVAAAQPEIQWD